jgi:transposase
VATLAVTRRFDLSDAQWRRLEPLLPVGKGPGRPSRWTKRQLTDGIRWRVRVGSPWRDVPECYGSWRAVYGLFRRWQRAGVWAAIMTGLQADADAAGLITWEVSVDSMIARAHQHAAGARTRPQDLKELPGGVVDEPEDHALGRSRGGLTTKIHLRVSRVKKSCRCWSPPGSEGLASVPARPGEDPCAPHRAGTSAKAPRPGPRRQGIRFPRQPRLPAQTRYQLHDPAQGRPDPPSQEQGQPGRPTARVAGYRRARFPDPKQ